MRVAIVSSILPFVGGGARNIADWLAIEIERAGHSVEKINLPFSDDPGVLVDQLAAYRWVEVYNADRVICLRPPAHLVRHDKKILWFIHHLRFYYDLWDTPYRGFADDAWHRSLRDSLRLVDNAALGESLKVFTNSKAVSDRLTRYNAVDSEVLYPPLFEAEKYQSGLFGDEILYVSRLEHHKRQHLAIQAMRHVSSDVKLRIAGSGSNVEYVDGLLRDVRKYGLEDRVVIETEWVEEGRKVGLYSQALAVAYLPFEEDSYGYPSLEAFHSGKPVVTTDDSGGVLEIVEDGVTGIVAKPSASSLANAFDRLYEDRAFAARLGEQGRSRIAELNINWEHVLRKLLS